MLRLTIIITILFIIAGCTVSCKKDYSYEGGIRVDKAKGTLQDSTGNCYQASINGNYIKDTALNSLNTVKVFIKITQPGKYTISTDTVNGCWFNDTGFLANTGLQSLILKGYGKPATTNAFTFHVRFDSSYCGFTIPTASAVFTFDAPVGACPDTKVNGQYKVGKGLNNSDTVNVPVHVSLPGNYNVQTTVVNGITFSAKGTFINTGNTTLTMVGSGVPVFPGVTTIPVKIALENCSFLVEVSNRIIDTSQFWKFTAEGVNYKGYVDSIYPFVGTLHGHPADTIHSREFFGLFPDSLTATNSLTFQFDIGRINHEITTGVYHPGLVADFKDFYGDIFYYNSITGINYNISTTLSAFTVNLDTYNLNTRLMHCTFSGPVLDAQGKVVNISNGEVKVYLAY